MFKISALSKIPLSSMEGLAVPIKLTPTLIVALRATLGDDATRLKLIAPDSTVELGQGLNRLFLEIPLLDVGDSEFKPSPSHTKIISSISVKILTSKPNTVKALIAFILENSTRTLVQHSYSAAKPFGIPDYLIWKLRKVLWRNWRPIYIWELKHRSTGWIRKST